ncbi:MAG: hypothetical protein MJY57_02970 [Bacteroidales bacterium]|nr:hypothetical protein [Bacteroidales bacterium]
MQETIINNTMFNQTLFNYEAPSLDMTELEADSFICQSNSLTLPDFVEVEEEW